MTEALGRSFASLQIPNFRRYFAGQLVSISGNWMQTIAEMWLVLSLTGSGLRSASPPRSSSCRC